MKITIDDKEINDAIRDYVISQGIDVADSDVLVEFIAGRKKGNSANITIVPKGTLPIANTTEKADDNTETSEEESGEKLNLFDKK